MSKPYWEQEVPEETTTKKLGFRLYAKAGKLQIVKLWRDYETGEARPGKMVVIDQEDLALHPEARRLLQYVLENWQ